MADANTILIVADVLEHHEGRLSPFWPDMPTEHEVETISAWLRSIGFDVGVVNRVVDFLDHIAEHDVDIVLPLWRAGESRNRTGVVPAVCEAKGIPFVGADAFGQVVCQDKALSKTLLRRSGLKTPCDVVWKRPTEINAFSVAATLTFPVVIKPLYGACSIGVDERSLCVSESQITEKARDLFSCGLGPVICEEFVAGDEISICIIEERGAVIDRCIAMYKDQSGRCPFVENLFTFAAKTTESANWWIDSLPIDSVSELVWTQLSAMVASLGKVDLCRIDGRLHEGVFTVIEITPDIHLGLDSLFLGGFAAAGIDPAETLGKVIRASLSNQSVTVGVR
jgi:D-alanine-D-alanine ligase